MGTARVAMMSFMADLWIVGYSIAFVVYGGALIYEARANGWYNLESRRTKRPPPLDIRKTSSASVSKGLAILLYDQLKHGQCSQHYARILFFISLTRLGRFFICIITGRFRTLGASSNNSRSVESPPCCSDLGWIISPSFVWHIHNTGSTPPPRRLMGTNAGGNSSTAAIEQRRGRSYRLSWSRTEGEEMQRRCGEPRGTARCSLSAVKESKACNAWFLCRLMIAAC